MTTPFLCLVWFYLETEFKIPDYKIPVWGSLLSKYYYGRPIVIIPKPLRNSLGTMIFEFCVKISPLL